MKNKNLLVIAAALLLSADARHFAHRSKVSEHQVEAFTSTNWLDWTKLGWGVVYGAYS